MSHRITIKDIAAYTGVSVGTVDRVLHGRGHVSPVVTERILVAMKELGYAPNILARALANNHKPLRIAAILPDYRKDLYWVQPKEGVERAAADAAHYGITVQYYFFSQFNPLDFTEKANEALAEKPDALLFAPVFMTEAGRLLDEAACRNLCAVTINTQIEHPAVLSYIGQDSYQSGFLAGRLLDFGLHTGESAVIINLDTGVSNAKHLLDKQRGFEDFFKGVAGKDIGILKEVIENFNDRTYLARWTQDFFGKNPTVTGVFVTNSRAYKLVEALVPDLQTRLKIVGFDLVQPNIDLLVQNKVRFLINQNAWQQGYLGLLSIVKTLVLKKTVPAFQYLPLDIVVKENAEYYLKRALELPMAVV